MANFDDSYGLLLFCIRRKPQSVCDVYFVQKNVQDMFLLFAINY